MISSLQETRIFASKQITRINQKRIWTHLLE